MPVIIADEIARQIDALPDEVAEQHSASSFGIVVPPFSQCFIEADVMLPDDGLVQRGVIVRDHTKALRDGTLDPHMRSFAPASTRWLFSVTGYLHTPKHNSMVLEHEGLMLVHLDGEGYLLDNPAEMHIIIPRNDRRPGRLPAATLPTHGPYLLKAISAMHRRCPADKVTPNRAAIRQARRKGMPLLTEYYVLRVQPHASPQDYSEVGQPSAAQTREHLVRGHFKRFTEERPMFGRYVGMVWVPEHERGNSDIGRIRKDYRVD